MEKFCLRVMLIGALLISVGVCQAVDKKIYSVADGENDRYGHYPNGTRNTMWADFGSYSSVRRAVIMFPTSDINGFELRGAELNMWGGRSSTGGSATLKIYHYGYDGWSDSSIPYASSLGPLLTTVPVSEVLNGYYPNRNKYAFSIGNNMPYDNDGYLSLALVASGNNVAFYTRNTVTWDGSKGLEPYLTFRTWANTNLNNSNFSQQFSESEWVENGSGSANVVNYEGNNVAELTTGSPVGITQIIDTPKDEFYILFDYKFMTESGILSVSLTDRNGSKQVFGQLSAEDFFGNPMARAALHVGGPEWLYLDNAVLGFEFDGITGSQVLLDNVEFSNVPEPATLALLSLGGIAIVRRRLKA